MMVHSVNWELMARQLPVFGGLADSYSNGLMDQLTTMAERIADAMRPDSFVTAAGKLAAAGCEITHTAIHKWVRGGAITEPNLEAFCDVYGVNAPWVRYGVGPRDRGQPFYSTTDQRLGIALQIMEGMPDYGVDKAIKDLADISELITQAKGNGAKG